MVDERVKKIDTKKKSITNQANMELGFPMELKFTPAPSEDALMSNIDESNSKDLFDPMV